MDTPEEHPDRAEGAHIERARNPIATPAAPKTLAEIRADLPTPDPAFLRDIDRVRSEDRPPG